jgi:hypothetical protein
MWKCFLQTILSVKPKKMSDSEEDLGDAGSLNSDTDSENDQSRLAPTTLSETVVFTVGYFPIYHSFFSFLCLFIYLFPILLYLSPSFWMHFPSVFVFFFLSLSNSHSFDIFLLFKFVFLSMFFLLAHPCSHLSLPLFVSLRTCLSLYSHLSCLSRA